VERLTKKDQRELERERKREEQAFRAVQATPKEMQKLMWDGPDPTTVETLLNTLEAGATLDDACSLINLHSSQVQRWLARGEEEMAARGSPYADFRTRYVAALRRRGTAQRTSRYGLTHLEEVALTLFTRERRERLLDYLRGGVFAHVAAEAVGIPAHILALWIDEGRSHEDSPYSDFFTEAMMAQAQGRAAAEIQVHDENPLAWLMNGPGRDRMDNPGWTRETRVTGSGGGPLTIVHTQWGGAAAVSDENALAVEQAQTNNSPTQGLIAEAHGIPLDK